MRKLKVLEVGAVLLCTSLLLAAAVPPATLQAAKSAAEAVPLRADTLLSAAGTGAPAPASPAPEKPVATTVKEHEFTAQSVAPAAPGDEQAATRAPCLGDKDINGVGTTTFEMPFATYWQDGRTQSIYLASEFNCSDGGPISGMRYYVTTAPGQAMNAFMIRLRHTTKTQYATTGEFDTTGWTVVYGPTTLNPPPAGGWYTFTFDTPFAYNGVDNLEVDVTFNNSSYTTYGYVWSFSASPNYRTLYKRCDSCACPTGGPTNPADWGPTCAGTRSYSVPRAQFIFPPPAEGACCINYQCYSPYVEADCLAAGGAYYGGQDCATFYCPPINDNCANVTPVPLTAGVPQVFMGNNLGATHDCAYFPSGAGETWEAFTLSGSPTGWDVVLDYCGTTAGWGNAWLNLALGCPCTGYTAGATFNTTTCANANVWMKWAPLGPTGLADGTYYYPVMLDPALGAAGPYTITVVATPHVPSYCAAAATSTADETIERVQLNTIDNASTDICDLYEDFTAISTDLMVGQSYPLTILIGDCENASCYSKRVAAYIDWNQDIDWDDAGELVYDSGQLDSTPCPDETLTGSVVVPIGTPLGCTRMRIINREGTQSVPPPPCGTFTWGAVEDYTVCVIAAPPEGACCLNISECQWPLSQTACEALGGIYQGDGSDCDPNPCPQLGACCFQVQCEVLYEDECVGFGGIYQGAFTVCEPNPCKGACCFQNGTCQEAADAAACTALGGASFAGPGTVCDPNPCPPPSYCAAGSSYANCDEYISQVTIADIDNATGCSQPGGYGDFTYLSTNLMISIGAPITVINGNPYTSDQCKVWVDWNQDYDFTDADEGFTMAGSPGNGPYTGVIVPPAGALLGPTTMRVRITYTGALEPCGTTTYGEVEDYTINVLEYTETGACCVGETCTFVANAAECAALGGLFTQGITCDPNPCIGACCFQTDCYLLTEYDCVSFGGVFKGGATTCDPSPCVGACCYSSGACDIQTAALCVAAGGIYEGDATVCDPNPCPQPEPGDNCGLPIVVTLPAQFPYTETDQYTCGRGNDYTETCLGYYDGGEDIIYQLNVTEPICLGVSVIGDSSNNWIGCGIWNSCPLPTSCYGQTTSGYIIGFSVVLTPGTWYMMIDTWPSPNCLTAFDLSLTASTVCPQGACCLPGQGAYGCYVTFEDACLFYGGTFIGDGTVCSGLDCNANGADDACDIGTGASEDCNGNGIPDECDLASGFSVDVDGNGVPDDCDPDCNLNGVPDACELPGGCATGNCATVFPALCGTACDCQGDGIPDACQLGAAGRPACDEVVYDAGVCDGVNGVRPTVGWNDTGVVDKFVVPQNDGPLTFACFHMEVLDNTGTAMTSLRLQIYALPTGSILADLPSFAGATALFDYTYTVAAGELVITPRAECYPGIPAFDYDASGPSYALTPGAYAVLVTFPTFGAVNYWASAAADGMGNSYIWGAQVDAPSDSGMEMAFRFMGGAGGTDCNANGIPDECEVPPLCQAGQACFPAECDVDCNANLVPDSCEPDCNLNGVADECDIATGYSQDCNANEIPDECDIAGGTSEDCNLNGIPDECELENGTQFDCNGNGVLDVCDIASGYSIDADLNGVPDECDPDCNLNGVPDGCEMPGGCALGNCGVLYPALCATACDCQGDGIPDDCQLGTAKSRVTYQLDDGVSEDGLGITAGADLGALVLHTVVAGGESIESISIAWGACPAGLPFTAYVWSDPDQNGTPHDGLVIGSAASTIANPGTDTFNLVTFDPPVFVGPEGTKFFIGYVVTMPAGANYPLSLDQTAPVAGRNWILGSAYSTPPVDPNDLDNPAYNVQPGTTESFGFAGNLMIRGEGISGQQGADCNANGIPDECDTPPLCQAGAPCFPAQCSTDCNGNAIPDDCEVDCNENGIPDDCDIASGFSIDCNGNGVPDECDIAAGTSLDCNNNTRPDECDIAGGTSADCNENGVPDECDIASGFSEDCQGEFGDGIPDECQLWDEKERDVVLTEGFEVSVPPAGWTAIATHSGNMTWYQTTGSFYEGAASAQCEWDPALVPQDEWLLSPEFTLFGDVTVTGATMGSVYWGVTPFENYDIELWAVVGAVGGGDDVLISQLDQEYWTANWTWATFSEVFTAPAAPFKLGVRYVGADGAQGNVDALVMSGSLGTPPNDCNGNSVPDECDIEDGFSTDYNHNGVPDECEMCGDIDEDGDVDADDYWYFLDSFATCIGNIKYNPACDFDGDECITFVDFQNWRLCYLMANGKEFRPPAPGPKKGSLAPGNVAPVRAPTR